MITTPRKVALAAVAALLLASALTGRPAHAAQPFGSTACAGVRPGAWMEGPRGTVYTMGFIFKGIDTKRKAANYMMTVGNYAFPGFGTKKWTGVGPQAFDARGKPIGRFLYAVHTDTPEFSSFGLVKLDKQVKPNAQVCHFGGPTAVYEASEVAPRTVGYYGNGFPVDSLTPARTALVTGTTDKSTALALGVMSLVDTGDTGAPFVVDGKALGYWDGGVGVGDGGAGLVVSRLGPWITKVQKGLGIKLTLLTAKPL